MSITIVSSELLFDNYSSLMDGPFGDEIAMPERDFHAARSLTALGQPTELFVSRFDLQEAAQITIPRLTLPNDVVIDETEFTVNGVGSGYRLGWRGLLPRAELPLNPKEALQSANMRLAVFGRDTEGVAYAAEIRAIRDGQVAGIITVRNYIAGRQGAVYYGAEFPESATARSGEAPNPGSTRAGLIGNAVIGFIVEQVSVRNLVRLHSARN